MPNATTSVASRPVAVAALLLSATLAHADVIYVDDDAAGLGDGSSWADAYPHLQDALAGAGSGDEIRVAQGTYVPDRSAAAPAGTGLRLSAFVLVTDVAVLGGYAGVGAGDPDARDVEAHATILSADLAGDDASGGTPAENAYHVVIGSGAAASAVLDGFTITGGYSADQFTNPNRFGAGVLVQAGSPTIRRCRIAGNHAQFGGGVLIDNASSPTFVECSILDNRAAQQGAGIYTNSSGVPSFVSCTFAGNTESTNGGGAYVRRNGSFVNCVFSGNEAAQGAGVYLILGTADVRNCTVSGNVATGDGGGFYAASGGNFRISFLRNCISWGNAPNELVEAGGGLDVEFSNIEGGFVGTGNIDLDPLFVDADGADDTPGTDDDDLRLAPGSPSTEAGDNGAVPSDAADVDGDGDLGETLPLDRAGRDRIFDADGLGGATVDQGAYEVPNAPPNADFITVQLTDIGSAADVRFDAGSSSDPNDDLATLVFQWTIDGTIVCTGDEASCAIIEQALAFGAHDVTLRVTDPDGAFDETSATITLDPAELTVFRVKDLKVEFDHDPMRIKAEGEIGLPFGVDYAEVFAMAQIGADVGGVNVLPDPLVTVFPEVEGGEDEKWKLHDHEVGVGIHRFEVDWKGMRYEFKDFDVELKSELIMSSETTLKFKYKMDDIGGPFSITFDSDSTSTDDDLVTIDVAADGTVSSPTPGVAIEVEKPGEEAYLTLPIPLRDTSTITFTGAIDESVAVVDELEGSIGKFKLQIDFDPATLPDGAMTTPVEVDVLVFIGAVGYPGTIHLDAADLEVKDDEWKYDD